MSTTDRLPDDWHDLAVTLETEGFAGRQPAVQTVVRAARAAGLTGVLIDILADPAQPEVARLRAFGRLTATLASLDGRRPDVRPAA